LINTSLNVLKYYNSCSKGNIHACKYFRFLTTKAFRLKELIYSEYCDRNDLEACDELGLIYGELCEMEDVDACKKSFSSFIRNIQR